MDLLKINSVESSRNTGVGTWVQELGKESILSPPCVPWNYDPQRGGISTHTFCVHGRECRWAGHTRKSSLISNGK